MKGNWDKMLLIFVALLVVGLAGWFGFKAISFKSQFELTSATPNNEFPETKMTQTVTATEYVKRATNWTLPEKGTPPKPLPLFVSIPIVEIGGNTIDMLSPDAQLIRSPVSNEWLLSNNLDFLNKNVLTLDPDRDGYTNLEEWSGKTNPKDSESHPAYADKLVMVKRHSVVYRVLFAARPDDTRYQIRRLPSSKYPKAENSYVAIGETTKDEMLRVDSFKEKRAKSKIGIMVDASTLDVTFMPKGSKHILVRNVPEDIPTYYVEIEFLLEPGSTFFVKEGDTFPLAKDPGTKYRVTKVTESSATVVYESAPGQSKTVEIKKK